MDSFVIPGFEAFAKPPTSAADLSGWVPSMHDVQKKTTGPAKNKKKKKKAIASVEGMSPEELDVFQEDHNRRGVVYISRIPPYMKPEKVRHELQKYGDLLRIYLTPEDDAIHKKRKRFKGNSKKNYVDGWVEFADKAVAKRVAKTLNANPVGGKKGGFYRDDLWNLKYLPDFKWRHLTESITRLNVEKKHHLQKELQHAKAERDFYTARVEQNKEYKARDERLREQGRLESDGTSGSAVQSKRSAKANGKLRPPNTYRQRQPVLATDGGGDTSSSEPGRAAKCSKLSPSAGTHDADVLSLLFRSSKA